MKAIYILGIIFGIFLGVAFSVSLPLFFLIVGGVVLLLYGIYSYYYPERGFLAAIFFLPIRGISFFSIKVGDIILLVFLVSFFLDIIIHKKNFSFKTPLTLGIGVFILSVFLSFINTSHLFYGVVDLSRHLLSFTLFFVVVDVVKNRKMFQNTIVAILGSAFVLSIFSIIGFFYAQVGVSSILVRVVSSIVSLFDIVNAYANFLLLPMFLCLSLFVFKKGRARILSIVFFLFFLIALVFTFSRGGMLAFLVGLLIFSFLIKKKLLAKTVLYLFFIFGILSMFYSPLTIIDTFQEKIGLYEYRPYTATESRLYIWESGLEAFKAHPVIGIGLSNFLYDYDLYKLPTATGLARQKNMLTPHNLFIRALAELGVIGFIVILYILYKSFFIFLQNIKISEGSLRYYGIGLFCGYIATFFQGLFIDIFHFRHVWILLGLGVALYTINGFGGNS